MVSIPEEETSAPLEPTPTEETSPMEETTTTTTEGETNNETIPTESVTTTTGTENEEIVNQLEEEFKDRYTENEGAEKVDGFKALLEKKDVPPPVVPDYAGTTTTTTTKTNGTTKSPTNDRKRSRSKSPPYEGETLKRKGMYGCYSFFVFYY